MPHTEADTRANLIDPLLRECGWRAKDIVREYYFTDGRKLIGGKRGKRYFIDYLLHYNNTNFNIETRSERAFAVHYRRYIERHHNEKVREFPNFILERYEKDGVKEMGSDKLSSLIKLSHIERNEIKEAFEGAANIRCGVFWVAERDLSMKLCYI